MPGVGGQDRVINCGRLRTTTLEGPTTSSRGGPIKGFPLFLAQPGGPSGGRLRTTTLEGPKTTLTPPPAFQCASCPAHLHAASAVGDTDGDHVHAQGERQLLRCDGRRMLHTPSSHRVNAPAGGERARRRALVGYDACVRGGARFGGGARLGGGGGARRGRRWRWRGLGVDLRRVVRDLARG